MTIPPLPLKGIRLLSLLEHILAPQIDTFTYVPEIESKSNDIFLSVCIHMQNRALHTFTEGWLHTF